MIIANQTRSNAFPISTPGRNVDQLMKGIYNYDKRILFLMSCESKSFCSFMLTAGGGLSSQISLLICFIADSLLKAKGDTTKRENS